VNATPALRTGLTHAQACLVGLLIVLTVSLQGMALYAFVVVRSAAAATDNHTYGIGNLSNLQREFLLLGVGAEQLPQTRDVDALRLRRSLIAQQLSALGRVQRDHPSAGRITAPIVEGLVTVDSELASIKSGASLEALHQAAGRLRGPLSDLQLATKRMYDRQEQRLFQVSVEAHGFRARLQAVLLATTVTTLFVAGALAWSLRRKTAGEFTRAYEALRHQAFHDSLTGLPNRAAALRRLEEHVADANSGDVVALFIDVDGFKTVNDSLGHDAGDQLLCVVAERLRSLLRGGDMLARLGGDEFLVLVEGKSDNASPFADALAQRVIAAMSTPITVGGYAVSVGASVGIALANSGDSAAEVLRNADTAMYEAKERGRGRVERFRDELHERAVSRLAVASRLRDGIRRGELVVHYQPVVELDTGRTTSVEALVRWNDPDRGLLSPFHFVAVAEDTGLIVEVDHWVLGQACAQVARWNVSAQHQLGLSANISARTLADRNLPVRVRQVLRDSGFNPELLRLEITESTLMSDPDRAADVLDELRRMGVSIAIDDFGTGYSSFSHVRRFEASYLKIDKSFVDDIVTDQRVESIVSAIVTMAHSLGMRVTAEGVERHAQLERLLHAGCDEVQGYLLSRPVPGDELIAMLHDEQQSRSRLTAGAVL